MYRRINSELQVFLAHPGGPYYAKKDDGFWGIPKGEVELEEHFLDAAIREFQEETGLCPTGPYLPLGSVKLKSGKTVYAWAFTGDWDGRPLASNHFEMEWPPKSGQLQSFPEVDKADFFSIPAARRKIHPAQQAFLDRLTEILH